MTTLAKYCNDCNRHPTSIMKLISTNGRPILCLFATQSITIGTEITYDYGMDVNHEMWWRYVSEIHIYLSSFNQLHNTVLTEIMDLS